MVRLTLLDVCNALFKVKRFAPIEFCLIKPVILAQDSQIRKRKYVFVFDGTLYCVYRDVKFHAFGQTVQFAVVLHRKWILNIEDICMVSYLFYIMSLADFKVRTAYESVDLLREDWTNWKKLLSRDALDVVKNTRDCSELVPFGMGYLFQNNYHKTYEPIEITLHNEHHIRLRVAFSRMTWNDVLVQAKSWILLHYLTHPNVVQDIYAQLTAMQNGYLGFFTCEIDSLQNNVTHFGLGTSNTKGLWRNPNDVLQSLLLPQSLCDLIWSYLFDVAQHKKRIQTTQVPRSDKTYEFSTWRKPLRLFAS
jgi:hypothetical protein